MPESSSDKKKNIWFFIILGILILASVGVTFYKYYILKDFQIVAEVSCDPATEVCFHYEPTPCADDDLECVPEEAYDYKMMSKNAANILACENTEEKIDCTEELSCLDNEENCSYEYCTEEALSDGVTCVNQ